MNFWLLLGGVLSGAASLAHLVIIVWGPQGYQVFGAGQRMVRLAEQGSPVATAITLGIAAVLAIWAAYAFSGAGLLPRLPLLKSALMAITTVYLMRAVVFIPALMMTTGKVGTFAWVSSAIVLAFGLVHLMGVVTSWSRL